MHIPLFKIFGKYLNKLQSNVIYRTLSPYLTLLTSQQTNKHARSCVYGVKRSNYDVTRSDYDVTKSNHDVTFQNMLEARVAVCWYIVERVYREVLPLSLRI